MVELDTKIFSEHSQAADFIERALFTYERAFVGAFTFTNGLNRLDFDRVENRPFFLALHRQVMYVNSIDHNEFNSFLFISH
jgi:Transcriptional repressor TCF25